MFGRSSAGEGRLQSVTTTFGICSPIYPETWFGKSTRPLRIYSPGYGGIATDLPLDKRKGSGPVQKVKRILHVP